MRSEGKAFIASSAEEAQKAAADLKAIYGDHDPAKADVIVALGGDGFMLQTLHQTMNSGKLVYGMNRGSVGFLMNRYSTENLADRICQAVENAFHPLEMQTTDVYGESFTALASTEEESIPPESVKAVSLRPARRIFTASASSARYLSASSASGTSRLPSSRSCHQVLFSARPFTTRTSCPGATWLTPS